MIHVKRGAISADLANANETAFNLANGKPEFMNKPGRQALQ